MTQTPDDPAARTLRMPDTAGATTIAEPPTGKPGDFDFFIGDWRVRHRRLRARLAGCDDWVDFDGTCSVRALLGGDGNVDDNVLALPGSAYRAVTLRTFDTATRRWSIWWLDGRHPHRLDPPMIGGFDQGIGTFFADDRFEGRPIRVRFVWRATDPQSPRWEQAFSVDGGETWETNWTMDFVRAVR